MGTPTESHLSSAPCGTLHASTLAALDIGSNSFHLVIARRVNTDFQFLEREKVQIQLAAGLNHKNELEATTVDQAMKCLNRFSEVIKRYQPDATRAVATHTLRIASNSKQFIKAAQNHFPVPIEIVSGTEEARLIYQGVAHLSNIREQTLVIDIGGGSTEFIIGADFKELKLRSCTFGCINLTREFFPDGVITKKHYRRLIDKVYDEVDTFRASYLQTGWRHCLGSSGSIRMIDRILKERGYRKRTITLDHLIDMKNELLSFETLDQISMPGLTEDRTAILPAAVGILIAVFKSLGIEHMSYCKGALREGLLYSMINPSPLKSAARIG